MGRWRRQRQYLSLAELRKPRFWRGVLLSRKGWGSFQYERIGRLCMYLCFGTGKGRRGFFRVTEMARGYLCPPDFFMDGHGANTGRKV